MTTAALRTCRTGKLESYGYIQGPREGESRRRVAATERTTLSPSSAVVQEFMKNLKEAAKLAAVTGKLSQLKAIATELFDCVSDLRIVTDPEIPDVRYVTMSVQTHENPRTAASLRREWYRKVHGVLGELSWFTVNWNRNGLRLASGE